MKLTKPITMAQLKSFSEVDICDTFEVASERTVRWKGSNYEIDGDDVHVTRFFNGFLTSMGSAYMAGACIDSDAWEDGDLTLGEALKEINNSIKRINRAVEHHKEGSERFVAEATKSSSMRGCKTSVPKTTKKSCLPKLNVRGMF